MEGKKARKNGGRGNERKYKHRRGAIIEHQREVKGRKEMKRE